MTHSLTWLPCAFRECHFIRPKILSTFGSWLWDWFPCLSRRCCPWFGFFVKRDRITLFICRSFATRPRDLLSPAPSLFLFRECLAFISDGQKLNRILVTYGSRRRLFDFVAKLSLTPDGSTSPFLPSPFLERRQEWPGQNDLSRIRNGHLGHDFICSWSGRWFCGEFLPLNFLLDRTLPFTTKCQSEMKPGLIPGYTYI